MPGLFADLRERGFVHQATPGLDAHLARAGVPVTVYCGFDPTAASLQLGNLIPLLLLRRLQQAGHRPIVLMGGGTGLIGDPAGKRTERPLLAPAQLAENLERQRAQMARFLDFGAGPAGARLRDNAEWLAPARLVDFLRDVGKHFTINVMLQKESVQARLDAGLSFTEFSYMLLQAYDFLQLFRHEGCTLQVGGSDQWGNITAGVELIRRVEGAEAHALVAPLITTATGAKFGKSETGALYLDPALTSPYRFHQFWVNTDDRDVARYLKLFTFRTVDGPDGIAALLAAQAREPGRRRAQHALARDVTTFVHGEEAMRRAATAGDILFDEWDPRQAEPEVFDVIAAEIPTLEVDRIAGVALADAVQACGLARSRGEARRQIEQGGVYVNLRREGDGKRVLTEADALPGGNVLLRKGKKQFALLRARRG